MRTITFYSYKGGVGRTLVVANVAKYLARLGKKVFVIDFDLEAPGLHYKFSLERGGGKQIERGLVDVLLAFTEQRRLPESLADYAIDIPPPPASSGAIRLMPAGAAPSPAYWRKLSSIDWHELFYSEHPEGVPLFLELKARIEEAFTPDFLLIDARTGITEMGGAATTVLADQVVCLMLKTVETLAGTRAVMRGIQSAPRPDGGGPVELIAVLSRVPTRPDPRGEDAEAASVLSYLNEPGDDLAANLAIREVVTLHTERVLEEKEQLLVGGTHSPHETPLLRDYLRLFTKIIPPEDIGANIGQFANEIRLRAFEDPDGAEADLESLIMSCPHPEAYRALLQLYRLRQSGHEKELRTAFMIWDITRDSADPLLWDVVRTRFNSGIGRRLESPHFTLEFVEAVWRAAGADDAKVGQALAEAYRHGKALDRAAKVLSTCIDNVSEPSPGLAIQAIELFRDMGSLDQAHDVITRFKNQLADAQAFLVAWAELILRDESASASSVLDDPCFNFRLVGESNPLTAALLYQKAGLLDQEESKRITELDEAIRSGDRDRIAGAGATFNAIGKLEEFQRLASGCISQYELDSVMKRIETEALATELHRRIQES